LGDSFLLCSDGLYDLVEDAEIKQAVLSGDLPLACKNLIELAKSRGGHDNVTVAIVALKSPGEATAAGSAQASAQTESAELPVTRELETV
jgi:serine/threonine protein phosphatase PrpC